jgi:hypothetical protein
MLLLTAPIFFFSLIIQVYESTNGPEQSIISKGTTLKEAATSSSDCVAVRNQLFPDAGTSYGLDDLAPWTDLGSGMTMTQVWLVWRQ